VRVYTYHELPGTSALIDEPVLVREGFNWPAALFTAVWALWHGLWVPAVGILVISAVLEAGLAFSGADTVTQIAAAVGVAAIVGYCANDWRRNKLRKRGYRLSGIVAADSVDTARRRWFDLNPAVRAAPETSP
jgi:hypothetical protein